MIPSGRAVFIPAHCSHAIRMWGLVEMRTLYLSPAFTGFAATECRVFEVSPLLRELILRTVLRMALDSRVEHDARMIGLVEDEVTSAMTAAEHSPLVLPMPRFRDETGMSFGMWRQKARLLNSIRLLAEGTQVTDAALDCGYSSVSAFIAAFKGTFGYTPGRL